MTVKRKLSVFRSRTFLLGLLALCSSNVADATLKVELNSVNFHEINMEDAWKDKIPVIYDTAGVDGELQNELAKSVFVALRVLDKGLLEPLFLDMSKFDSTSKVHAHQKCTKILIANKFKVGVSLLQGEDLKKLALTYDTMVGKLEEPIRPNSSLSIYTPRTFVGSWKIPSSVTVKSLQMSEDARAVALLNRVAKVGVRTLIPILDGDSPSQFDLLKSYYNFGSKGGSRKIKFTKPILLNDPVHVDHFKRILEENSRMYDSDHNSVLSKNSSLPDLKPGVLVLATKGSQTVVRIAAERNHHLLSWFSPNMLEFEEWVVNKLYAKSNNNNNNNNNNQDGRGVSRITNSETVTGNGGQAGKNKDPFQGTTANNSPFGLYTVNFVGSKGWDNPMRRRMLRELNPISGASPRILIAVLAYDAAWIARDQLKGESKLPKSGLSGVIEFDEAGFRKEGTYLGSSAVPSTGSSSVTLLQPSLWILEDMISLKEGVDGVPEVTDYDIATSSILTNDELLRIANSTRTQAGCKEHLMSIVTYDPFNQMPYHYFFTETSLPDTIVLPNHQGFGITFVCTHFHSENQVKRNNISNETGANGDDEDDSLISTLQLACTPGRRMNHPISCFRSHINKRHKRDTSDQVSVPNVQYQYSFSNGGDPWGSQNSQWANPRNDYKNQQYYYQQPGIKNRDYQVETATQAGYDRTDVPIEESPSTAAPAPPPPATSKLPELRQILKAAKPFVGSCIGSSTGCAMCVLVLGRLPLGALPAACTGPCFVGTFGSCGSLLGRVFSETTVICTELFRQGLLDADTFVADAEFGKHLADSSPYTMQGYSLLATPLVDVMKSSKFVTNIVATFALPWAHHMKYLLGRTSEPSLIGSLVHFIGYPLCNVVGRAYVLYNNFTAYSLAYGIRVLMSPLLTFLMTLVFTILLIPNLGFSTSTQRYNIFQTAILLYILTGKSRKLLQTGASYLRALGRST